MTCDSCCPACLAPVQAPLGTQLAPPQDPKLPGLVSQGSCCLLSAHKLPRSKGAAPRATQSGTLEPTTVPWSGREGEASRKSQGLPSSLATILRGPPVTPPPPQSQTRGTGKRKCGAAGGRRPREVPAVPLWGGMRGQRGTAGGSGGARPGTQAGSERAWTVRALKGRQGLGPPPVSAAPRGWSPSDPDDPGPRPLPSQRRPQPSPGCGQSSGGAGAVEVGGSPRRRDALPAGPVLRRGSRPRPRPSPALPAGLTSATWRRLLSPRGPGGAAPGLLACTGRSTTSAAGLPL